MHGQRIGYVRVSSFDQNPERQLEQIQVDKVFTDKASGKDTRRPELERLLAFVREGDTVVVHSMDRLARNLDDLRRLVQGLTQRGVRIEFLKEHLTFTGEDSPMANLMLSVMGAFAEFERALIRERQREGIALAKQRGAYRGRKKSLSSEGTVAKLAMRQPFVLFKGLTFQKLCLPGAFRPGDHHNKMLRPGLCVVHASPQYL
ncbi:TnpR recombinase [Klebsiella pneumoniae]|nr:TnpR recombinase [Klebsiella pneumoniae]